MLLAQRPAALEVARTHGGFGAALADGGQNEKQASEAFLCGGEVQKYYCGKFPKSANFCLLS
jgi:hypothetical protein